MIGPARGCFLLLLCAAASQALAGVSATLDTAQIASGDTVQLTLEHDGRTSGQPDLAPLQQNFDILGSSSNTTYELMNGSASERSEVVLTLAPKVTGKVTIPPLSWDGEQSQPLTLTVAGAGSAGQAGAPGTAGAAKVFIQTSVSPQKPYVEAAVELTVRLFISETLYHGDLELPDNSNVVMKQIGADEDSDVQRDGRTYQVVTRRYLLFPMHSGPLTLQGPVLDAQIAAGEPRSAFGNSPFGGFFGGRFFGGVLRTLQPIRVHGKPIVLAVQPRPAAAVGSYWLPARNLTVSASWKPATLSAHAGDPLTMDLDLQATGLTAAQLPDLSALLRLPSGLKAYPDQAKLQDSSQNGELVGSRDQTIALMADSPGHYTIPALTVTWWDTEGNRPRTATLPARTLNILPAPLSASSGSATAAASAPSAAPPGRAPAASPLRPRAVPAARRPVPHQSGSRWEWISIGLAVMWLATLAAWLWTHRSRAKPASSGGGNPHRQPQARPDAGRERAAFRSACEANDATAARAHLLAWARARWGTIPAGINAVAANFDNPGVAALLRDLDRACYAGGGWQGHELAAALAELPALPGKADRDSDKLAPLYP